MAHAASEISVAEGGKIFINAVVGCTYTTPAQSTGDSTTVRGSATNTAARWSAEDINTAS